MNTPEPCDFCEHLYWNALYKDDPTYEAECKKEHTLGNKACPDFKDYRELRYRERPVRFIVNRKEQEDGS